LKYMYDLLQEKGCGHIKIFAGGGGVILPDEIAELEAYGITKIYSPDDGRAMGLEGMIIDLLQKSDYPTGNNLTTEIENIKNKNPKDIGHLISAVENYGDASATVKMMTQVKELASASKTPILGITGTGGSGKSSTVDEIVRRFLLDF